MGNFAVHPASFSGGAYLEVSESQNKNFKISQNYLKNNNKYKNNGKVWDPFSHLFPFLSVALVDLLSSVF